MEIRLHPALVSLEPLTPGENPKLTYGELTCLVYTKINFGL